jgi:urease accessory protein
MIAPEVLLLADSRLPSGGHGHSGGIEAAVTEGLVDGPVALESFLRGRLRTAGLVLAAFAAGAALLAATADTAQPDRPDWADRPDRPDWAGWDRALTVRTPAPALRAASRSQGAALLRTASRMWDTPALAALRALGRPHQPLVLGAAVAAGGGAPADAAALAGHHLTGGACSAAVRLLGLDPLAVAAVQAAVAPEIARAAETGLRAAELAVHSGVTEALPSVSAVLPELLAARHAESEVSLFAS